MIYKNRHLIFGQKVIKIQLVLGLVCALAVAGLTRNYNSVVSAVVGTGLVVLPTMAHSMIAFAKGSIAFPVVALGRHQKAMIVRFVLNLILFSAVLIVYRQCDFIVLFSTYLITFSGYWFSLVFPN